jgi:sugar O-acyltransferase (sialic acid O-acetyltransferase NeuD family)
MTTKTTYIIGAGGHAKVVIATLKAANHKITGILDDSTTVWGKKIWDIPIQGACSMLEDYDNIQAIIAIGNNRVRQTIARHYPHVTWLTVIHPSAQVHASVEIGTGTVIFANAVIQPDSIIGNHVIVNTAATADHDCVLEDYVQIAPGVHLSGACHLQQGAFMGTGSSSLPQTIVGAWSTVGAGAVVIDNIPNGSVAYGVPAKPR